MKLSIIFKRYKYIIALVLGTLFILSGCKSAELKTLEDSASVLQLNTGREINRTIQDHKVVLGKPVYAELTIEYEPNQGYTNREVYEEIVKILEKNEWIPDKVNIVPDYYSASVDLGNTVLIVSLFINPEKDLVSIQFVNLKQ